MVKEIKATRKSERQTHKAERKCRHAERHALRRDFRAAQKSHRRRLPGPLSSSFCSSATATATMPGAFDATGPDDAARRTDLELDLAARERAMELRERELRGREMALEERVRGREGKDEK